MKIRTIGAAIFRCVLLACALGAAALPARAEEAGWRAGYAEADITPKDLIWMGGFAARTRPAEGTLDRLRVQALALEAADGGKALLVTGDLVGIPKWLYDWLSEQLRERRGLARAQIRISASHTHSGPVLREALQDIYPLDDGQRALIADYSEWVKDAFLETAEKALGAMQPASLAAGEGRATFAMNRRANLESEATEKLRGRVPFNGPSDFAVPVLAVRGPGGELRAAVFGYAAHTSALTDNYLWSADYSGEARRALEAAHPGAAAMFFQGCGSDQSAVPRGTPERSRKLGEELAAAVEQVLDSPMRPVAPRFRAAHEFIEIPFGEQPSKAELEEAAAGADYRARWARRLLAEAAAGRGFETSYPAYPVQVWRLGEDQLWIALGGEVCVDYALRFKKDLWPGAWVAGYSNDVMAYIPSRRLWEEGGYQAGAFEVYGLPATRWSGEIEELIAGAVRRLAEETR